MTLQKPTFVFNAYNNRLTLVVTTIFVLCTLSFSIQTKAAILGDFFLNQQEPLFTQIAFCKDITEENLDEYAVELASNEPFNSDGLQPFTQKLSETTTIDLLDDTSGLITISADEIGVPENLQLIVTLIDSDGNQIDSQNYLNFTEINQTPDDVGCSVYLPQEEQLLVAEEEVQAQPALENVNDVFVIDVVKGDTWRNIAHIVNAAWFANTFEIDQVMAALYSANLEYQPYISAPNNDFKLPEKLNLPNEEQVGAINIRAAQSIAKLLDGTGSFAIENRLTQEIKKNEKNASTLTNLQSELNNVQNQLANLREQLELVRQQLTDSQERISLRDREIAELKTKITTTRQRVAELETKNAQLLARNSELEQTGMRAFLRMLSTEHMLFVLIIFAMLLWLIWFLLSRKTPVSTPSRYTSRMQKPTALGASNTDSSTKKVMSADARSRNISTRKNVTQVHNTPLTGTQIHQKTMNLNTTNVPSTQHSSPQPQPPVNNAAINPSDIPTIDEAPVTKSDPSQEIISTDSYRAQLDLANAYLSMGEDSGAKDILEGLLDCEDQAIRQEAERRLEHL